MKQPCASCPFREGNHKEFAAIAEALCAKFGQPKPNFWTCLTIRDRVKKDAIDNRRLLCHATVYDPATMRADTSAAQPCAGLTAYLKASD